jgi:NAD(P)-dependent dehydrogenase (short-subunit alcohol dehydrogenase family)
VSPGSIGAEFAITIAKYGPSQIILASRDVQKIHETASIIAEVAPSVTTRTLALDLGSLARIREAADEVKRYEDVKHIDVLVNSAGVMAGGERRTSDGIELQFGVNHVGHFLFTNLIMYKLLPTTMARPCRVVNVSSIGHEMSPIRFNDWNFKLPQTNVRNWLRFSTVATLIIYFRVMYVSTTSGLLMVNRKRQTCCSRWL